MEHTQNNSNWNWKTCAAALLAMGGLVEAQLQSGRWRRSPPAATSWSRRGARGEARQRCQIELDRKSMEVIAKRQPAAVDLRQIVCTMQAVNDLERIGDEVKKIAPCAAVPGLRNVFSTCAPTKHGTSARWRRKC